MVVTAFSLINMANHIRFFKEILLVGNVSPKVVFKMLFFNLSDANVDFLGREFW